jgi:hypothetical protein
MNCYPPKPLPGPGKQEASAPCSELSGRLETPFSQEGAAQQRGGGGGMHFPTSGM